MVCESLCDGEILSEILKCDHFHVEANVSKLAGGPTKPVEIALNPPYSK